MLLLVIVVLALRLCVVWRCCLPLVGCWLLDVACNLLFLLLFFGGWHVLFIVCCVSVAVRCLLVVGLCSLFVACCWSLDV